MLELDKLLELVEQVDAMQEQEKTILYSSDFHKYALEQYLNIKIESDDLIVSTVVGMLRLVRASSIVTRPIMENQMFIVEGLNV